MTTAATPLRPIDRWDTDPFSNARTPALAGGFVAFGILTHDQGLGQDYARIRNLALPDGCDSEDMAYFLWELINAAGEIGYATAMVNTAGLRSGPGYPEPTEPTVEAVSRAVAALTGYDVVDDDEAFDPEYRAKLMAASREAAAA